MANTTAEQFDVAKEVKTLHSMVTQTLNDIAFVHPVDYNNDLSNLFAEVTKLTPQQLNDTLTAMGSPKHGIIAPWQDQVTIARVNRDARGAITEIVFDQDRGILPNSKNGAGINGQIDMDFSKKTVSTSGYDMVGIGFAQISKI